MRVNKNIDQFSIYSAKILEVLSESFPVPHYVDEREITREYLKFTSNNDIKEARKKIDIADIITSIGHHAFSDDEISRAKEKQKELEEDVDQLEQEKRNDQNIQSSIFKGTLYFLTEEGVLRETEDGKHQLTSESFLHLNKEFEDGVINDKDAPINRLRGIFYNGVEISKDLAVKVAIDVISTALK